MSLVKILPAWFHAIADYAVGILLIVVALADNGSTGAVATGVVVGAVVLLVSALTRYPLGIVKVLPFPVHSGGDYLAAALLIVAPVRTELLGRRRRYGGVLRRDGCRGARGEPDHQLPVPNPGPAPSRPQPAPPPPPPGRGPRPPGPPRPFVPARPTPRGDWAGASKVGCVAPCLSRPRLSKRSTTTRFASTSPFPPPISSARSTPRSASSPTR